MTDSYSDNDLIKVELAVNTSKQEDEKKLFELLDKTKGVRILELSSTKQTMILELAKSSELGIVDIQNKIENSLGLEAVIKGIGSLLSGVSELRPLEESDQMKIGVIRFSQLLNRRCYVDGLIHGFSSTHGATDRRMYSAAIHEYGDLSGSNYENLGKPIIELKKDIEIPITEDDTPSVISLKTELENCDLASMIGRGVALSEILDRQTSSRVVSAGIISRASVISENDKKICTCSGKTIWQERLDASRSK